MSDRCNEHSEFFPCYERDGEDALDSKGRCVGCGVSMDSLERALAEEAIAWRANENTEAMFQQIAALRERVRVLELMRTGAIELIQDSGCFCDCECMHDEPYQHTGECGDICWACRLSAILADGGKG